MDDFSQAESKIKDALSHLKTTMKPTNVHRTLGQIYAKQERFAESTNEFETAYKIIAQNEQNLYLIITSLEDAENMYGEAGQLDKAKAAQQKAADYGAIRNRIPTRKI
jgi:uncharacterized protein HemY